MSYRRVRRIWTVYVSKEVFFKENGQGKKKKKKGTHIENEKKTAEITWIHTGEGRLG